MAGYSQAPLAKKLGIKDGFVIRLINEPDHYFELFSDLPKVKRATAKAGAKNFIHFFTRDAEELLSLLPLLRDELVPDGMIWVSWPKKASKVVTDVTESLVRETALANGLVDIKVCAVDEVWSGLKLVIPISMRNGSMAE